MKQEINSEIKEAVLKDLNEDDAINPSHYNGSISIIEVMMQQFGPDATMDFCLLNAFKYLSRCMKKHDSPIEDIKKAIWYENRFLELYPEVYECK